MQRTTQSKIVSYKFGSIVVASKLFKKGIQKGKKIPTKFIQPHSDESKELTFLGMFQNNNLNLVNLIAKGLFIEATIGYRYILDRILTHYKNSIGYSETSVKDISNYLYGFVLSYSDHRLYNMNKKYSETLLKEINDVYEFLINQPETKDMELLNQLTMDRFTNKLVFPNSSKFNASDLARMAEEFETIYMQKNTIFRTAAIKLIEYAYVTTGFKPTINSYNHLLPKTYFIESGHHVAIQNLLDMLNNPMNETVWNEITKMFIKKTQFILKKNLF